MPGGDAVAAGATRPDSVPLLLKAAATAPSATAVELYDAALALLDADDPVAEKVRAARARTLTTMGLGHEAGQAIEAIAGQVSRLADRLRLHVTGVLARLAAGASPEPVPDLATWCAQLDVDLEARDADEVRAVLEYALVQLITGHVAEARRALDLLAPAGVAAWTGDEVATILAGTLGATVAMYDGRVAEAAQLADDVRLLVRGTTHAGEVAGYVPLTGCGVVLARAGRPDDGLELLAAGRQMVRAYQLTWTEALCDANTAMVLFDAGRWDEALAAVDTGLATGACHGQFAFHPWMHAIRAIVRTRRGDLTGATLDLARAQASSATAFNGLDHRCWAEATLASARGDVGAELAAYHALVAHLDAAGVDRLPPAVGLDAVRAHLRAGERARAADLAARLPDDPDTPWLAAVARGAHGLLAQDATALGDAAQAVGPVSPHLSARLWEDAAVAALARSEAAGDHARRAAEGYRALGATAELERVARLVPGDLPARGSAGTGSGSGLDALTPTERRVVRLVAEGRSNAEIAEELAVSRRTVESHLRRVFTKVGVRSRLQLAVLAREHTPG